MFSVSLVISFTSSLISKMSFVLPSFKRIARTSRPYLLRAWCKSGPVAVAMGLVERLWQWAGRGGRRVAVLVAGLDGAGKTALLRALRPAHAAPLQPHTLLPTVGHHHYPDHFQSGPVTFSAWDVSGAARARALWERRAASAHALIFVVDASDALRLVVAREELAELLAAPSLSARRVPVLVFANKCDKPHALPHTQIAAALGLERITDKPWHVCAGSALSGAGVQDAVCWLARQLRDAAATPAHH